MVGHNVYGGPNLHSTMVGLKLTRVFILVVVFGHLHSTMVGLKHLSAFNIYLDPL